MCRNRIGPPSVGGPSRRGITRERANKMSVITNNRKAIPTIGIRWRQQLMRAATISISRLGCAMVVRCKAEQRNRHFPLPRSPHPGRSVEGRWSSRKSRGGGRPLTLPLIVSYRFATRLLGDDHRRGAGRLITRWRWQEDRDDPTPKDWPSTQDRQAFGALDNGGGGVRRCGDWCPYI